MKEYTVFFNNDMGHLEINNSSTLPDNIKKFAYNKIKNKVLCTTDNKNLGFRFFILIHGLNDRWTYEFKDCRITLDYSDLDKYDSRIMKSI